MHTMYTHLHTARILSNAHNVHTHLHSARILSNAHNVHTHTHTHAHTHAVIQHAYSQMHTMYTHTHTWSTCTFIQHAYSETRTHTARPPPPPPPPPPGETTSDCWMRRSLFFNRVRDMEAAQQQHQVTHTEELHNSGWQTPTRPTCHNKSTSTLPTH
ncbi:unnamed protein product [Arctogadus glacialis]